MSLQKQHNQIFKKSHKTCFLQFHLSGSLFIYLMYKDTNECF